MTTYSHLQGGGRVDISAGFSFSQMLCMCVCAHTRMCCLWVWVHIHMYICAHNKQRRTGSVLLFDFLSYSGFLTEPGAGLLASNS